MWIISLDVHAWYQVQLYRCTPAVLRATCLYFWVQLFTETYSGPPEYTMVPAIQKVQSVHVYPGVLLISKRYTNRLRAVRSRRQA